MVDPNIVKPTLILPYLHGELPSNIGVISY